MKFVPLLLSIAFIRYRVHAVLRTAVVDTGIELWKKKGITGNETQWTGPAWEILTDILRISELPHTFIDFTGYMVPGVNPWDRCIELIVSDVVDLCPLQLTPTEPRLNLVRFITPYTVEERHTAFILEHHLGHSETILPQAVMVFGKYVWMLLALTIVVLPVFGMVLEYLGGRGFFRYRFWKFADRVFGNLVNQGRGDVENEEGWLLNSPPPYSNTLSESVNIRIMETDFKPVPKPILTTGSVCSFNAFQARPRKQEISISPTLPSIKS